MHSCKRRKSFSLRNRGDWSHEDTRGWVGPDALALHFRSLDTHKHTHAATVIFFVFCLNCKSTISMSHLTPSWSHLKRLQVHHPFVSMQELWNTVQSKSTRLFYRHIYLYMFFCVFFNNQCDFPLMLLWSETITHPTRPLHTEQRSIAAHSLAVRTRDAS